VPIPHVPAFNVDAARVLLAGFLAGAAGGLATTGLALLALVRNPGARERLPAEMRFTTIGILAANALLFAWRRRARARSPARCSCGAGSPGRCGARPPSP
jgi:hypothetical protein